MISTNLFQLLIKGVRHPRYYIAAMVASKKQLRQLSFIAILMMTLALCVRVFPLLNGITQNISTIIPELPQYTITEKQQLQLTNSKPVYYQSPTFQLVVDDTVELQNNQNQLNIPTKTANRIQGDTLLNLFLFKNTAYAVVAGTTFALPNFYQAGETQQQLSNLLHTAANQQTNFLISLVVTSFIASVVTYWFIMLLTTLFSAGFNRFLSQPLRFNQRLKLIRLVSFMPILLIELLNIAFPMLALGYLSLIILSLWIMYAAIKEHTIFLHSMASQNEQELATQLLNQLLEHSKNNPEQPEIDIEEARENMQEFIKKIRDTDYDPTNDLLDDDHVAENKKSNDINKKD